MADDVKYCPHCGAFSLQNGKCFSCGYSAENSQQEIEQQVSQGQTSASTNLAPCPDCGHMVSMYATSCPNCGRPLKPIKELQTKPVEEKTEEDPEPQKTEKGNGCGTFFAVVLGILVAVWILTKILRIEVTGTIMPIK